MRQKLEAIKVQYSADGVLGDAELSHEQILNYGESLKRELESEYPGVQIEVELSINDHVSVYAGDNYALIQDTGSDVQQIIHNHWQQWIDEVAAL